MNVGKSKLEKFFSLIFNQLFWCSDFFHCCQIICLWWCQVDIPVYVVMFSENITIISEAEFCQNDPWNNGFLTDIKGSSNLTISQINLYCILGMNENLILLVQGLDKLLYICCSCDKNNCIWTAQLSVHTFSFAGFLFSTYIDWRMK